MSLASQERVASLVAVLNAVRRSDGVTQSELTEAVQLGRSVVAQRVSELEDLDLVVGIGHAPSTGGRAPRRLKLRADRGYVLGIDVAARELMVGVGDLSGLIHATSGQAINVMDGPETILALAEEHADKVLEHVAGPLLGVGVAIPSPVEFASGLPVAPPIMPAWDRYPIRERLSERYRAPTWVDNDVNVLTLGELRANPVAKTAGNLLYFFVDVGIGAGMAIGGEIYRGANGSAGDVGHVSIAEGGSAVCRCGNLGCLEAVAGGAAIEREARLLAETGQSGLLRDVLAATGTIRALDVTIAAQAGDLAARALLHRAANLVGSTLATLVSFLNPNLVLLGGGIVRAREFVVDDILAVVNARSLPLATRDLRVEIAALGELGGVTGAVHLVLDQIFTPAHAAPFVNASRSG